MVLRYVRKTIHLSLTLKKLDNISRHILTPVTRI